MAPKNLVKNLACVSVGLFLISLSSLLMIQIYFKNQINSQIQNSSILKDIRYPLWGKHPNPSQSQFKQTFTLFSLEEQDNEIKATKSNISKSYEYQFQYQNTSFAQGNSGRLNFINKWQLKQLIPNAPSPQKIKTINLAADKVFNYDFYAPPQRKFPILFNYIIEALSTTFLQKFYTTYLFEFFFQHKDLVLNTVFKPLGYDEQKALKIYEHSSFGWSNLQNFKSWVVLSLKGSKAGLKTEYYESLIMDLGLTSKQVQSLVFEKSTLYNMITALNGTIKSKLMMTGNTSFNYKCPDASCTNSELVAFQIANSFLTNDPLFASLNLSMGVKDLNSTFLADVQYQRFCDRNKGKFKCMSKTGMVKFFTHNYLGDFEKMNLLWNNKDKFDVIQKQFDLENNTGQSVVSYVLQIYDKFINKYENVFAWSQVSYNAIEPIITSYKNLLLVELYSRAYFNKFLDKKQIECADYFVGQFSDFAADACQIKDGKSDWNFAKYFPALQNWVKAYLYISNMRETLSNSVKISYEQLIAFFNNQEVSLFAKQLKQVESIFKASFGCVQDDLTLCTSEQLFCMQWGSNSIFQKLPSDIFQNKVKSINEWDTNNILNGFNPDFYAVTGKKATVDECTRILSSNSKEGIFSLFNILKMTEQTGNSESSDVLKYIGRTVMQINFNGLLNSQDVDSLFKGFKSQIITKKNELNISSGGAPWLENEIKLVKTDNKIDIKNNQLLLVPQFDTIDTGIYNQDKTRQISKIWGESTSSSKYTVYRGTKTDEDDKEIPVDIFQKYVTDRKVTGTNLLGFHPNIKSGQNLQVFVNQAHQSMNLAFVSQISYKEKEDSANPINAYKYSIEMANGQKKESFIGIEQLNQNYFELSPQSYAVVEPITGLTLELSLVYTIKAKPLYTKFLLNSSNSLIDLYSSQLFYKRRGLGDIQQIMSNTSSRRSWTIIALVVGSLSLALSIGLMVGYCKMSKKDDEIAVSLIENETENPVDYVE